MIACFIPFLLLIGSSLQATQFSAFQSNSGAPIPPPKLSTEQEELAVKKIIVEKVSKSRFLKNTSKINLKIYSPLPNF